MPKITNFQKKVYNTTKEIPKGYVSTYSGIAKAIGNPNAGRAVGNALNKNPFAPEVPCHRIIKSDGTIGGFAKGYDKKKEMLKSEGITINHTGKIHNFKEIQFHF